MFGLMFHQFLHTAVRGAAVLGTWDFCALFQWMEAEERWNPFKLFWQVSPGKNSKSAGSSVSPAAGNGCVFKCSLRNCDQIPQGHSLQDAFHHPKCDVTQRSLTKPSRGLSVMKLFQKSYFALNSCLILIQINFCVQTSPQGLTQGELQ